MHSFSSAFDSYNLVVLTREKIHYHTSRTGLMNYMDNTFLFIYMYKTEIQSGNKN